MPTICSAGTTANVTLTLHGPNNEQSKPILLVGHQLLRGTESNYIIRPPSGGTWSTITAITLCHDSSGSAPSWFCEWVRIRDERQRYDWIFHVNQWLSLVLGGEKKIACTVPLIRHDHFDHPSAHVWQRFRQSLTDQCLWFSIVFISPRSTFKRTERLTVFAASLTTTMLTNLMFFGQTKVETVEDEDSKYDQIELSIQMAVIAFESIMITCVVTILLTFLFQKSTPKKLEDSAAYQRKYLDESIMA